VDAVGVALAAAGLLDSLFAAFIHVASELTLILNPARLLPAVSRTPSRLDRRTGATTVAPAA
jgi:Cd2+/Zn2+-exporting ATPase/Cu+-exporting ATPase